MCLDVSKTAFNDFKIGIKDLKKKDPEDIAKGLKLLGSGLKVFYDSMSKCKSAYKDIVKLYSAIE